MRLFLYRDGAGAEQAAAKALVVIENFDVNGNSSASPPVPSD